jgi:ABC-type lipoprotein release transport system permease subunit
VWKEVVGVVSDVRTRGPARDVRPEFYLPLDQIPQDAWNWIERTMTVVLRADGGPEEALAPALVAAVRRLDPALPVYDVATMRQRAARLLAGARLQAWLLGSLAATGLALAAIGIYGVLAHWVHERRREIGVRQALGATRGGVLRLLVRQGMASAALGAAIGLLGALAAGRALQGQLAGVRSADPLTLSLALLLIGLAALAACLLPARAATAASVSTILRDG